MLESLKLNISLEPIQVMLSQMSVKLCQSLLNDPVILIVLIFPYYSNMTLECK